MMTIIINTIPILIKSEILNSMEKIIGTKVMKKITIIKNQIIAFLITRKISKLKIVSLEAVFSQQEKNLCHQLKSKSTIFMHI